MQQTGRFFETYDTSIRGLDFPQLHYKHESADDVNGYSLVSEPLEE
jgi:hypothetical protein